MSETQEIQVDTNVQFIGFQDPANLPDNAELLEEGEVYTVGSINDNGDDNDQSYNLLAPNPKFNPKRKVTKNNPEFIDVDVFADEVSLDIPEEDLEEEYDDEIAEDEGEEIVDEDAGDDGVEDEVEEEVAEETAPAPKTKTRAKAKAGTKKKTTAKGKAAKGKTDKDKDAKGDDDEPKDEADPGLAKMLILAADEEDQEIKDMVEEAEDIVALAEDLVEQERDIEYRLGGVLYHIRVDQSYKLIENGKYNTKGGWATFLQEELDMEYRKSMYLLDIYTKFNKFQVPGENVDAMGWSKAKEIARVMDETNVDRLLELAVKQPIKTLRETIRNEFSPKQNRTVQMHRFAFKVPEDAGKYLQAILDLAMEGSGAKKVDEVFEKILSEWAESHLDVSKLPDAVPAGLQERADAEAAQQVAAAKKVTGGKRRGTAKKTTAKGRVGRSRARATA